MPYERPRHANAARATAYELSTVAAELGAARCRSGKHSQSKPAALAPGEHFCQSRLDLVIADDEEVPWTGIDRDAGVAKMGMGHARLVLLVVIHPQLNGGVLHGTPPQADVIARRTRAS